MSVGGEEEMRDGGLDVPGLCEPCETSEYHDAEDAGCAAEKPVCDYAPAKDWKIFSLLCCALFANVLHRVEDDSKSISSA